MRLGLSHDDVDGHGQNALMRARQLAQIAPVVSPGDGAIDALRVLTSAGLPGLVVNDGESFMVVPASQVLRVALPRYIIENPSLGRVWDEASADEIASHLQGKRVSDLVRALGRDEGLPEPAVDGDATVVEVAAVMAAAHVPLVAVVEDGRYIGVITVNRLVGCLLG